MDDTTHIINCYAEDAGVNLTPEQMERVREWAKERPVSNGWDMIFYIREVATGKKASMSLAQMRELDRAFKAFCEARGVAYNVVNFLAWRELSTATA